jgi:hypothetical protein
MKQNPINYKIMKRQIFVLPFMLFSILVQAQLKALIVDGQNNHEVWPKSTIMMKQYLEETGLFEVDIQRTKYTWKAHREQVYLALAGVQNPRWIRIFHQSLKIMM